MVKPRKAPPLHLMMTLKYQELPVLALYREVHGPWKTLLDSNVYIQEVRLSASAMHSLNLQWLFAKILPAFRFLRMVYYLT